MKKHKIPTWLIIVIGGLGLIAVYVFFELHITNKNSAISQYVESQTGFNNSEASYDVTYDKRNKTITHNTVIKTAQKPPAFKMTVVAQYSNNDVNDALTSFRYYTDRNTLDLLAKNKIKIRFYTTTDDGTILEDITYNAKDYTKPVNDLELINHIESRLKKQVTSLLTRVPIKIDDGFTITNITYDKTSRIITYFITVDDYIYFQTQASDLSEYNDLILDFMITEFMKTINTGDAFQDGMNEVLGIYKKMGVKIRTAMIDERGNGICFNDKYLIN